MYAEKKEYPPREVTCEDDDRAFCAKAGKENCNFPCVADRCNRTCETCPLQLDEIPGGWTIYKPDPDACEDMNSNTLKCSSLKDLCDEEYVMDACPDTCGLCPDESTPIPEPTPPPTCDEGYVYNPEMEECEYDEECDDEYGCEDY